MAEICMARTARMPIEKITKAIRTSTIVNPAEAVAAGSIWFFGVGAVRMESLLIVEPMLFIKQTAPGHAFVGRG
jgi:hypothetical protein